MQTKFKLHISRDSKNNDCRYDWDDSNGRFFTKYFPEFYHLLLIADIRYRGSSREFKSRDQKSQKQSIMARLCYTISYVWLLGLLFYLYFKAFKLKIPLLNWWPMVPPVQKGMRPWMFPEAEFMQNNRLSCWILCPIYTFPKFLGKEMSTNSESTYPLISMFLIYENKKSLHYKQKKH